MTRAPALTLAVLLMTAPLAVWAQSATGGAADSARAASPAASAASAVSAGAKLDESLQRQVIEDDGVRIEETRLRGAATHITVQSKVPGAKPYQIQVAPAGRDRSEPRGGAGQRAWTLFDF